MVPALLACWLLLNVQAASAFSSSRSTLVLRGLQPMTHEIPADLLDDASQSGHAVAPAGQYPASGHNVPAGEAVDQASANEQTVIVKTNGAHIGQGETLAYFLVASVATLMFVFNLSNSNVSRLQLTTWRVLNTAVSIFAAVVLYGALKDLIEQVVCTKQDRPGGECTTPNKHVFAAVNLSLFVILFVGTHVLLFKLKSGDERRLQAAGTILGHMCGFAAIFGFSESPMVFMTELGPGHGAMLVLILCAAFVIAALSFAMDIVMKRVSKSDGFVSESEERWIEVCEETDDDVFCLTISFLFVALLRDVIRGEHQQSAPGSAKNDKALSYRHADFLFVYALGFVLISAAVTAVMNKYQHSLPEKSGKRRCATLLQSFTSLTTAWCFLFWAEWQLYVWGWNQSVMGACVTIALFMTIISFVSVFVLSKVVVHFRRTKIMRRGMGSMVLSLGVLTGFSWERAFEVAFNEVEEKWHQVGSSYRYSAALGPLLTHVIVDTAVIALALSLFAIVATAWRFHILPKAKRLEENDDAP